MPIYLYTNTGMSFNVGFLSYMAGLCHIIEAHIRFPTRYGFKILNKNKLIRLIKSDFRLLVQAGF